MPLLPNAIDDFVVATQSKFTRDTWVNLVHDYPSYIATKLIAEKGKSEDGGPDLRWLVKTGTDNNATTTGLYAQVRTNVDDNLHEAVVPWRFQTTSWAYDKREAAFQSDRETIVSLIKTRDVGARDDMVKLQEDLLWGCPTSDSDTSALHGITYWFTKDASTTPNGAFNGGAASGHTTVGGLSSTTYPRWRNWTAGYTTPNTDDLVKKIKRAMVNTDFQAPVPVPGQPTKLNRQMFADYDNVIEPLERLAETRNQNLGRDLAMYMGQVTIGHVPLTTSFWLQNNDTSYPVYGIDFSTFYPVVKRGYNMLRLAPEAMPGQPLVMRSLIMHGMNYKCASRRNSFVISKA